MSDTMYPAGYVLLGVGRGAADGIDDALGLRGEQTPSTQRMFAGIGGVETSRNGTLAPSWSKSTSR
jgi:hypothetical protein